jgi:membrane protein
VYGKEAAEGQIRAELHNFVGSEAAAAIEKILESAGTRENGRLAAVISGILLWLGASWVVLALKDALDTIWGVMPDPKRSWWKTVTDYLMALVLVLAVGVLLLASLLLTAALSAIAAFAQNHLPVSLPWAYWTTLVVSYFITVVLFAAIFRFLPDMRIRWSDVWIGASITALLFLLGKELIGLYLAKAGVASTYGAAGSLAVFLIWTYYSSLIFLLGAEFTQVYARTMGTPFEPSPGAVRVTGAYTADCRDRKQRRQDAAARESGASK